MAEDLPKEEAERRAREVAQRMLTTPKPKKDETSQRRRKPSSGDREPSECDRSSDRYGPGPRASGSQ